MMNEKRAAKLPNIKEYSAPEVKLNCFIMYYIQKMKQGAMIKGFFSFPSPLRSVSVPDTLI